MAINSMTTNWNPGDIFARTDPRRAGPFAGAPARETAEAPVAPEQVALPKRTSPFRAGTPPGGVAEQHEKSALIAGASVGEPGSYAGGAGAPSPIAVMRGMKTTYQAPYSGDTGTFLAPETATPLQAKQIYNQAARADFIAEEKAKAEEAGVTDPTIEARATQKFGEWRSPGQTIAEIEGKAKVEAATAAARNAYYDAAGQRIQTENLDLQTKAIQDVGNKARAEFRKMGIKRYGTYKDGKAVAPTDEALARDMDEAEDHAHRVALENKDIQKGADAGMEYMTVSQQLRELYPEEYKAAIGKNPLIWNNYVRGMIPRFRERQAGGGVGATSSPPIGETPQPWKPGVSPFWKKLGSTLSPPIAEQNASEKMWP